MKAGTTTRSNFNNQRDILGEPTPERYAMLATGFLSGSALVLVAAFADSRGDDFPSVAVILAAGTALLWAVAIVMRLRPRRITITVWMCAAAWCVGCERYMT